MVFRKTVWEVECRGAQGSPVVSLVEQNPEEEPRPGGLPIWPLYP